MMQSLHPWSTSWLNFPEVKGEFEIPDIGGVSLPKSQPEPRLTFCMKSCPKHCQTGQGLEGMASLLP